MNSSSDQSKYRVWDYPIREQVSFWDSCKFSESIYVVYYTGSSLTEQSALKNVTFVKKLGHEKKNV